MTWHGDSKGHQKAAKAVKHRGWKINPGNFKNDREKAKRAGSIGGKWQRRKNT